MMINQIRRLRRRCHALVFPQGRPRNMVGTHTWGGLVGIGGYPPLIDGGT